MQVGDGVGDRRADHRGMAGVGDLQKLRLTPKHERAIRERFGALVDVEREMRNADAYLQVHTGRPYKNLGRFFWNWCRRAEESALRRMARAEQAVVERRRRAAEEMEAAAPAPREWSDEELAALLADETAELREFARAELRRRGKLLERGGEGA